MQLCTQSLPRTYIPTVIDSDFTKYLKSWWSEWNVSEAIEADKPKMETDQLQRRTIHGNPPSSKDPIEVGSEWVVREGVQGRDTSCRGLERSGITNKFESHVIGEHMKTKGILWSYWSGGEVSSRASAVGIITCLLLTKGRPYRLMLARKLSGTVSTATFRQLTRLTQIDPRPNHHQDHHL